jgi:ribosomal protein S12 methylthiotransferase
LQQRISREINETWIGKKIPVLIEEAEPEEASVYRGRTERDAPEVDGQVIVHSDRVLKPGQFVDVEVTDALEYDLIGTAPE